MTTIVKRATLPRRVRTNGMNTIPMRTATNKRKYRCAPRGSSSVTCDTLFKLPACNHQTSLRSEEVVCRTSFPSLPMASLEI